MIPASEYRKLMGGAKKPNKHRAKPVVYKGIRFASGRECERYKELELLEKAKSIRSLKTQVGFPLIVNEILIAMYVADFTYFELRGDDKYRAPVYVVEDSKSPHLRKHPVFRIKQKLMRALRGIEIRLT